ncbi:MULTISPECIES: globin [Thiomicrorhabdus]|uniref:Globin n=1 Tax=Thiomicrorhabdus heinhorstiae TaxID=2748010 RepID=A0ABS0BWQ1_9GAMM|nr:MULTISPECIES: globin [Thiomicrorhabdus]MBF6058233.1 globin [Thiomicrorhabdus heinhorstiae]
MNTPKTSPGSCPVSPAFRREDYPDAPFPDQEIYQHLGEESIRKLIRRHHRLMRTSHIGHLFGKDDQRFERIIEYTCDYFVEMLGGPKYFTGQRGEPRLGRRHRPFALTPADREAWLDFFRQALMENAIPQEIAQNLWNWVEPLSMRFLTPRIAPQQLQRMYLYTDKTGKTDD